MEPTLKPGQVVFGVGFYRKLRPRHIVIVRHNGLEKVKRIERIEGQQVYLLGDNPAASTDSRDFGLVPISSVVARVLFIR